MYSRNNAQTPKFILTQNLEDTKSSETNISGLILRFKFFPRVLGNLDDKVMIIYVFGDLEYAEVTCYQPI